MSIYFIISIFPTLAKPYSGYFLLGAFSVIFSVLEIIIFVGVIYTFYLVVKYIIERRKNKC